jgi:hypothetical protein
MNNIKFLISIIVILLFSNNIIFAQFGGGHSKFYGNAVFQYGNVGIEEINPVSKLQVGKQIDGHHPLVSINAEDIPHPNSGTNPSARVTLRVKGSNIGGPGSAIFIAHKANNDEVFVIKGDGNVGIGTTGPTEKLHVNGNGLAIEWKIISDERFKEDIKPLKNSLDNVLKLNGVNYNWKIDEFPNKNFNNNTQLGFIAQELEKVIPELVSTDSEGYKSISYNSISERLFVMIA